MYIRELMKENPECVTTECSVKDAAATMAKRECGVLPVVEGARSSHAKRPVGVVTDRDIVLRCVTQGADASRSKVGEICTTSIVQCDGDCPVEEAFATMRSRNVGRLLVTDDNGGLIGIVSMADIIARAPREILDQLPGAAKARPRHAA